MNEKSKITKLSTGIPGLDEILKGGLISGDTYLISGGPGTGKTTIGLQFLCEDNGEEGKALFISLSESVEKIKRDARQKNFNIQNINFIDFTPSDKINANELEYNIFPSEEVEEPSLMQELTDQIEKINPTRILIDGITQIQYLSSDKYQFRKQILYLLNFMNYKGVTTLISSEASEVMEDDDLQFMTDGVINLEFTGEERFIMVSKFRGSDFQNGRHSILINSKGVEVFPKMTKKGIKRNFTYEILSSGVPELDELLNGGIEKGTATLISGPTGVGKTTLAAQIAKEAAGRGERSVVYSFEEGKESFIQRCKGVNIPIDKMVEQNNFSVMQVNPLEFSPDQFAQHVRNEVEKMDTKIVILDSISGYLISFSKRNSVNNNEILRHIHALSEYMKDSGVTFLLINEVHNITGEFKVSEYGASYLADNIIFIRYLEYKGEMKKAIGVLKKRLSNFEKTLREYEITSKGIKIGRPLQELRGILSGNPQISKDQHDQD